MELRFQVFAWVLAQCSYTCYSLTNTAGSGVNLKKVKDVRQHMRQEDELADDDPGNRERAKPGENLVEVSPHGQLLSKQAEPTKKPYYFQVYRESAESAALMEDQTLEFEEELDGGMEALIEGSSDCTEHGTRPHTRDFHTLGEGSVSQLMGFVPENADTEEDITSLSCAREMNEEYRFLTKWRLRSGVSGDAPSTAKEIRIDYKCCSYGDPDVKLEECIWMCAPGGPVIMDANNPDPRINACQQETMYPPEPSHGSILVLEHPYLAIACPMTNDGEGIRALVSWFMENTTVTRNGGAVRLRYYCCAQAADAEIKFNGETLEIATDPQWKDDRISALTTHNVECPVGTAMSAWRLKETEFHKFHIVATCQKLNGLPDISGSGTCTWNGDPHFRCFGDECNHDPMSPTTGFYWIIKNDVVQVQGYYQGLDSSQPMRTKGVAIGGKFLMGCKVIVNHRTRRLDAVDAPKAYEQPSDSDSQICFCSGECTAEMCMMGDMTDVAKSCHDEGNLEADVGSEDEASDDSLKTFITKSGSTTTVLMPMAIKYVATHKSTWMDNLIETPKMPGEWDGQCGNWNGNSADDVVGSDDAFRIGKDCGCGLNCHETDDCFKDALKDECLFYGHYTGHAGIGGGLSGGSMTLEECPAETLKEANEVCNMLFPDPMDASKKALNKVYHRMCLLDECNTQGADNKADIANGDKEAMEVNVLSIDDANPRLYKPTAIPTSAAESESHVFCKTSYGAETMLAKPTTLVENAVIMEFKDDWATKEAASDVVTSTDCLKIGIWKNGPADDQQWYWIPDYLSATTKRCDDTWKTRDGATQWSGYVKDCLDTSDYGVPVSEAYDHLWAGTESNNQKTIGLANPNLDAVCVYNDEHGEPKWMAYASSDLNSHACVEEKRFGIVAGSNAVMARSYCGLNKQLALVKSLHEVSLLLATQLLGLKAGDETIEVYIGAAWVEGHWMWDDGTPVPHDADMWAAGEDPNTGGENVFLCMTLPSVHLKACQGLDANSDPIERNILCENTHEEKPCPMSMYPQNKLKYGPGCDNNFCTGGLDNEGALWPLPMRAARYQGRCYYIGTHKESCEEVCRQSVRSVWRNGETLFAACDADGLKKIRTKTACQMVVASFKLQSDNVESTTGWVDGNSENGCMFEQRGQDPPKVITQVSNDEGTPPVFLRDPQCDSTPDRGQHRVCACTLAHEDFTGALGIGRFIEISGLNSPVANLMQIEEAKKEKAKAKEKAAKDALIQRAAAEGKAKSLEGSLEQKPWLEPTTTTLWQPIEDTTAAPPPNPLVETWKIELIDASASAGAQQETENDNNGVLAESGDKLGAFTSITFEANPHDKKITRCYHKVDDNGDDAGSDCSTSAIWPWDNGVGATEDAWSIDIKEMANSYEIYLNGRRYGLFDMPRLESDFPTGVQLSGAYSGNVALIPAMKSGMAHYNYLPENGCEKFLHKVEGPVASWYFTFVSENLGGTQSVHGIPGDFIANSQIYFFNGGLRIVLTDNGPREITFAYQFSTFRVYGITIHYLKSERVVELYINNKRVEYQYFDGAWQDVAIPEGLLGCSEYETSTNKFLGKIWEFYVEQTTPLFRPLKDQCVNQHCEEPQWKQKADYATKECTNSICNHTIDESVCCDKMPLCKNAVNPFTCEAGSDWAGWADTTYCEDTMCTLGESELCCAPKDKCSSVECGQYHVLIPDPGETTCTKGLTCDFENETSPDFERCCEPVQNCSTHVCDDGYTHKPHSLSVPCKGRECTRADDEATCCSPKGMCTLLRCPGDMQHKPNASEIECVDTSCDESSYDECCMQDGRCDSIECPSPEILIAAATSTYCHGLQCDRSPGSRDMQLCCELPAPCSWYASEWCGPDYVHKTFYLNKSNAYCPGRVCREGEDKHACCEEKAYCDAKICPDDMTFLANYLDILCDSIDCDNTNDNKCCSKEASCSTHNCSSSLGNYVLRPNHSIETCAEVNCKASDLDTCCQRAPLCDKLICPSSMVPHVEASTRYCEAAECTLNDKARCCTPKMTCDNFDCDAHGMLYRHDAEFTLCDGADCNTTKPELCCVHKGSCLSVKCDNSQGLVHIPTAADVTCVGGDCSSDTGSAVSRCCEQMETCSSATRFSCPRKYNPKQGAESITCKERFCSHADLHTCCQMEGWCVNRTCPIGWKHRPDAWDTLCDDMACSEEITPEEKCCAEKGRCNSYECPHKYLPKLNASKIDCSDFVCTDDDLPICCDNATECSHHSCDLGMALRGDHADHVCKERDCSGVDHELCCVPLGSCKSLPCLEGTQHIMNEDLLCTDPFCNETENSVCCESKADCITYKCPDGFVHRDDYGACLETNCTDHDRDNCCKPQGYCDDANYDCPEGMTPKVNHHNLFCPESECTTNDRLVCCTFSDRCDSMQCPPGFLHRHDAYELKCNSDNCNQDEDHELCCVREKSCWSWKCPDDYVHRHNASKIDCADWKCRVEVDLDTCCLPRAPCNELQCHTKSKEAGMNPTLDNRWDSPNLLCVNQSCNWTDVRDEETCCDADHMCSTYQCDKGMMHRHNASSIPCDDMNCTDTSDDTCCAAMDMCHTYACPKAYIHLADADTQECQGYVCDDTDLETCCEHVEWCNAMDCGTVHTNKVDAAGRLCASAACNKEEDLDQCCDMAHTCENKICDEGWVLKMDAPNKPCTDVNCLNTANDYCCEERPHCYSDLPCPAEWVQKEPIANRILRCESGHRNEQGELICTEEDMKDVCCVPIETCNQYDPPQGFYLKPDGWMKNCVSWKCTDVDLHTCAGEAGMCGNFTCTKGYTHRHDAHHIMCSDMDCDATNETTCCVPERHCLSLKCDADQVHQHLDVDSFCKGETCDPAIDNSHCCKKAPTCNAMHCGDRWSLRPHPNNISCIHFPETGDCNPVTDKQTCCTENNMCTTYPCGDAMLHRHNAHEVMCHDGDCHLTNESTCCAMMGFCPTYKCPPHMVHKKKSETTQCRDDLCSDADKHYCCDMRATCKLFKCPPGKVWIDYHNMEDYLCDGYQCENPRDDQNCCKMEEPCADNAECNFDGCVNQENGFLSICSAGSEEPGDRDDYGTKSLPGECYQKKNDDFKCFNQPCYYVPPGAGANEWCCNGDLLRSCEAKIVKDGRSAWPDVTGGESAEGQASEYDETSTTDADAGGGTKGDIESGARLSYTACHLFGNVKVAALFVAGLLSFLPIATHVM